MADEVVYKIIIEGQGSGTEAASAPSPVARTARGKKEKTTADFLEKYVANKVKPVAAIGFAMSVAQGIGNYAINRVELQTGHSTFQQRAQFVHDKVWSFAQSAFAGAAAGAAFGPAGAVIGSLISVTTTGIKYAIDVTKSEQELRLKRQLEAVTLNLANIRAGTGADRGRVISY